MLLVSLIRNELECVKFFLRRLPLNVIRPRGLPVIQNFQNLITIFLLIFVKRKIFFCSFKWTLGMKEKFRATRLYILHFLKSLRSVLD